MIKITISHNGKEYDDLNNAFSDAIQNGIVEMLRMKIEKNLKHLHLEMEKEGGKMIINLGDALNGENSNLSASGFSSELMIKIREALSK
ncbi:MAG: hypothetical protein JZU53_04550 [Paludibacter sp.]|nr:hypothetical protein [Paludibacter sp.]